ncbi:Crp/Fnr family transcriptional regulator [Marinomonas posidonica]|uniref:Transcriptional regulator, Crp/Fnr family n=1 Tax=Marinomonas posidonica (strain CECT 7376 / NCIMB 14433 / IVIA-Po-181) TaxID=491952 RepID=F6CRZ4_MARPP|nr:Crp/Fnr family transcriptional regulator [Marinomonas posidonica]AEF56101.1 putative transcriptional regulator, Crp/Fnr family [Marinomonas posidonica IVIA-Po-181]
MDKAQLLVSFQQYFSEQGYEINWQSLTLPMTFHAVSKGDYLFRQGEYAQRIFFLHKGLVRYVNTSEEGKEFTKTFVRAPKVIGSTRAMVENSPTLFGIQALQDCVISSYDWLSFYEQMHQDLGFLTYYSRFMEQIFLKKDQRESAFVEHSAERRYLDFCVDYPDLKDSIPQQQIASYLGITPVALSRIRQKIRLKPEA